MLKSWGTKSLIQSLSQKRPYQPFNRQLPLDGEHFDSLRVVTCLDPKKRINWGSSFQTGGWKPNENLQGLQLTSATRERNSHKQARQTRVPPILSSANLQLWYGNFGHPSKNMARRVQWWAYQGKKDSALGIKHGHIARSARLLWLMKSIILDLFLQIITLAGFWILDFQNLLFMPTQLIYCKAVEKWLHCCQNTLGVTKFLHVSFSGSFLLATTEFLQRVHQGFRSLASMLESWWQNPMAGIGSHPPF